MAFTNFIPITPFFLLSPIIYLLLRSLYRISPLHPLSHIPGPLFPRISSLWLIYHAYLGDEASTVHTLHQQHGTIVRTGPWSVDISDGAALKSIYIDKGGFLKSSHYTNFDIDGHRTIFSETDPEARAPRAKAVVGIFSSSNLRQGQTAIEKCVDSFVDCLRHGQLHNGEKVNVLVLARGLCIDMATVYCFGESYGGLDSVSNTITTGVVSCFIPFSRLWYLSAWAFKIWEWADTTIWPDDKAGKSIEMVDNYLQKVVDRTQSNLEKESATSNPYYQTRLLQAGYSPSETKAQCKDLIFAGLDSPGQVLGTICFMLAKYPDIYQKLRAELANVDPADDLQSFPYLYAVVREGLRIALANPARFPRSVPPEGWTFKETYFPDGTIVSCTPYDLHFNEEVFDHPCEFRPERWLNPTDEMNRDAMYFGVGPRQCIARNLATFELLLAVCKIAQSNVLKGAVCVRHKLEIVEWFISKVRDERIDIQWEEQTR